MQNADAITNPGNHIVFHNGCTHIALNNNPVYPTINNENNNPTIARAVRHFFKNPNLLVIHSVFANANNPNISIPQNIDHAPIGIHESKFTKL
jgi:hypothetical protein